MRLKPTERSPSGIRVYLNQPWNLIRTGFLLLTWIILGIHLELIDTTMPSLVERVRANYSDMGSALAFRNLGYLAANIAGFVLQDIVAKYSEGLLILSFILPAIVVFVTPFGTFLTLIFGLFFVQGIAQGLTDLAGIHILLSMWDENAATPINFVQFGYGIGAVLANLLARPFLIDHETVDMVGTSSTIVIPYSITAGLCVFIAAGHGLFYIREDKYQKQRLELRQVGYGTLSTKSQNTTHLVDEKADSPYSPRTVGWGDYRYGLTLSVVFIVYKLFISGNEQLFSKFFFTYLKSEQFHLSNNTAIWDTIAYWLAFSIGRLLAALLSLYFSVYVCMNLVWFGGSCLAISWLLLMWTIGLTTTSLLILGAITGLVFAPLFPLSFSLINERLNITPVLLASLLGGTALGAIIFSKLAGIVIDYNANYFPVLLIICTLMSIVIYVASNVVYFHHQGKDHPSIPNDDGDQQAYHHQRNHEEQ